MEPTAPMLGRPRHPTGTLKEWRRWPPVWTRHGCEHHLALRWNARTLILRPGFPTRQELAGKMDSGRNHQGSLRSPMMVAWLIGKIHGARGYTTVPGGRPARAPVNLPIPTRDQGCGDWWSEITRAKWAPGYPPGTPESPRGIHMWGWLVRDNATNLSNLKPQTSFSRE